MPRLTHIRFPAPRISLFIELLCLLLTAPILFFSSRFPAALSITALLILGCAWIARRTLVGIWLARTPADVVVAIFCLLLPLAVWVAPSPLRLQYSFPRAFVLVWDICLFWTLVTHSRRRSYSLFAWGYVCSGVLIAVAAIFGTRWVNKLPMLAPILGGLPTPLLGLFDGAAEGFSPNQVAGTLLFVLPFLLAMLGGELSNRRRFWVCIVALLSLLLLTFVFVASQSRAGYLGMIVSLAIMLFAPRVWGRRLLALAGVIALALLVVVPIPEILLRLDSTTRFDSIEGGVNIIGRFEIWRRALYVIQDFPLTGIGLGTFRASVPVLYPLFTIQPAFDIAHAHNYFLQVAVDFGLPGLVTLLALYIVAVMQGIVLWRVNPFAESRWWSIGLLAALGGQSAYSLADAVAPGAKTSFFGWYLLALLIGLGTASYRELHSDGGRTG